MNKEYDYIDGKVIITSNNKEKEVREYYDNLDKVLVQENLLEKIEKKINKLQKRLEEIKQNKDKKYKMYFLPVLLKGIILAELLLNFIMVPFIIMPSASEEISRSLISFSIIAPGALFALVAGTIELNEYLIYKSSMKEEAKIEISLTETIEYLNKTYAKEKEKLDELTKEKTNTNTNNEFRTVKVNDKKELKKFKEKLNLIYNLSYNQEIYNSYFKQGILGEKLQEDFSEEDIDFAKEYFYKKSLELKRSNQIGQ